MRALRIQRYVLRTIFVLEEEEGDMRNSANPVLWLNDMITSFPRKKAFPPFVMRKSDGGVYLLTHHSFLLVTDPLLPESLPRPPLQIPMHPHAEEAKSLLLVRTHL